LFSLKPLFTPYNPRSPPNKPYIQSISDLYTPNLVYYHNQNPKMETKTEVKTVKSGNRDITTVNRADPKGDIELEFSDAIIPKQAFPALKALIEKYEKAETDGLYCQPCCYDREITQTTTTLCNTTYHYERVNGIACQKNQEPYGLFGVPVEYVNWSLSPMENCQQHEGHSTSPGIIDISPDCQK
jgi:hypothetical protein